MRPAQPAAAARSPWTEERGERGERPRRDAAPRFGAVRYRISVGRDQGVMPKDIVGAIANEAGIAGKYIGQINLFDDYSTVELPADLPTDLMDILGRIRVRQLPLKTRAIAPGEFVDSKPARRPGPPRDERKPPWKGTDDTRPARTRSEDTRPARTRSDDTRPPWKKTDGTKRTDAPNPAWKKRER